MVFANAIILKVRPVFLLLLVMAIILLLTVPKSIFDVFRYSLMSRPALLYGTPTDWNDVKGCLSRTYRQEVRDYFSSDNSYSPTSTRTRLPLNIDVEWNWDRFSSNPSSSDENTVVSGTKHTLTNKTTTTSISTPRRRLLIAQYSGKGSYLRLLREVEPINKAYAKRWGHDYTTLIGTALKFPGFMYDDSNNNNNNNNNMNVDNQYCSNYINNTDGKNNTLASRQHYNYEAQSTFNKIPLLFKALEESPQNYDQVLILDTDTMIVDFDYDITSLLFSKSGDNDDDKDSSNVDGNDNDNTDGDNNGDINAFDTVGRRDYHEQDSANTSDNDSAENREQYDINDNNTTSKNADETSYFLVAYRVWSLDFSDTWDVNAGITLWNLHHPTTRSLAENWLKLSLSHPKNVLLKNDDQYYLQRSLQKVSADSITDKFGIISSVWKWFLRHSLLPLLSNYYWLGVVGDIESGSVTGSFYSNVNGGIRAIREEFEYYNATVVKHFKRGTNSWTRTGLEQRLMRIREAKADICKRWPNDCLL